MKLITAINNAKSEDFTIEEMLTRRSGSFLHTIVRICPPQNASLEDIYVNKDKIDLALRSLDGVSIFSVEMMNPYAHHKQLLLGEASSASAEANASEPESQPMEMLPESSNNDQSIIPEEEDDVEVTIDNDQLEGVEVKELEGSK